MKVTVVDLDFRNEFNALVDGGVQVELRLADQTLRFVISQDTVGNLRLYATLRPKLIAIQHVTVKTLIVLTASQATFQTSLMKRGKKE